MAFFLLLITAGVALLIYVPCLVIIGFEVYFKKYHKKHSQFRYRMLETNKYEIVS